MMMEESCNLLLTIESLSPILAAHPQKEPDMFRIYGDGVFLETVANDSPEMLAEFRALGYDKVEVRPVSDLFEGKQTEEEAERLAEKEYMPPPPAEIVFPEWMNDPRFFEEGKEMEALAAAGQAEQVDEEETENEGNAE